MVDFRQKIIEELSVLQKKENQERNVFKARAYGKVISQLKGLEHPIRSMEDIQEIEGVGDKIRGKIQEIFETGSLEAARKVKADVQVTMREVYMNMYGVGPVKAKDLAEKYPNVQTIEEFRNIVKENPKILNEKQHIGLRYYEDLLERIPIKEMELHDRLIGKQIPKNKLHYDIVGSYRRGAQNSGDIDVLVGYDTNVSDEDAQKSFRDMIIKLQDTGYICDILALGTKKCMAICKTSKTGKARRLDLLLTNSKEYPFALLYFTGSDKFNIQFRKKALQNGYTLNEHGLRKIQENDDREIPFMHKEEDIFKFLGIAYVTPEERNKMLKNG